MIFFLQYDVFSPLKIFCKFMVVKSSKKNSIPPCCKPNDLLCIVVCLFLIHLLAFLLKWIIWLKRNKTHLHSFTCRDLQDHKPYFLWAAARLRSGEFWNIHFMKSVWKLWNPRIPLVFIYWMFILCPAHGWLNFVWLNYVSSSWWL